MNIALLRGSYVSEARLLAVEEKGLKTMLTALLNIMGMAGLKPVWLSRTPMFEIVLRNARDLAVRDVMKR
jgi:hypothetical protein